MIFIDAEIFKRPSLQISNLSMNIGVSTFLVMSKNNAKANSR